LASFAVEAWQHPTPTFLDRLVVKNGSGDVVRSEVIASFHTPKK
jgi:hypothetical protein